MRLPPLTGPRCPHCTTTKNQECGWHACTTCPGFFIACLIFGSAAVAPRGIVCDFPSAVQLGASVARRALGAQEPAMGVREDCPRGLCSTDVRRCVVCISSDVKCRCMDLVFRAQILTEGRVSAPSWHQQHAGHTTPQRAHSSHKWFAEVLCLPHTFCFVFVLE